MSGKFGAVGHEAAGLRRTPGSVDRRQAALGRKVARCLRLCGSKNCVARTTRAACARRAHRARTLLRSPRTLATSSELELQRPARAARSSRSNRVLVRPRFVGFQRTATRATRGTTSFSSSRRLAPSSSRVKREARDVPARPREARDEPGRDRIADDRHDDRDRARRLLGGLAPPALPSVTMTSTLSRTSSVAKCGKPLEPALRPSVLDDDILSLDLPELRRPCRNASCMSSRRVGQTRRGTRSETPSPPAAPRRRAARRGDYLGPSRGRCVAPSRVLPQLLECRLEQRPDLRVALPPGLGLPLPAPGGPTPAAADLLAGVDRHLLADGA